VVFDFKKINRNYNFKMKNTFIVAFFFTFFTCFIKAQNIGSENLFSVFPVSSFTDNTTGSFKFSSTFSSSNSAWEIDWNETEVFSKLFKFDHPTNTDESFELRFGKGGQVYSLKSAFGEALPPQWRPKFDESGSVISRDTPSIVNGEILSEKGNWAPWVDEIWQLVSSDQNDSTTEIENGVSVEKVNTRNMHQAGSYLNNFAHRSSDLTSPFYSPIVASNYNEAKQEYSMVIWAQSENPSYVYDGRSDCNPCHKDRFKPFSLYYLRYKNIGDGIVQVNYLIYNYHKTRETNFFNVPFLGIRNSVLPHFFLSNPDTGYSHISMPNFNEGATTRNTLTDGWAAFSGSSDGDAPSLGFVFGNNTKGYADFRYGNALGPNSIRDATVLSYRLLKGGDNYWNLKEGKSFSGTYFMVLGSNINAISSKIQTKNLVLLANTELTDITLANSDNIYYKITLDGLGGYTIAESTAANNTLSFKSSPFKNSFPVFLIKATSGNSILTYDPYYYSLKPYDGAVSSIKLLGFSDTELTIDPLTYQKPALTTVHAVNQCKIIVNIGVSNATYKAADNNLDVTTNTNNLVSSILATQNLGSVFFDLDTNILINTSLEYSMRFYSENSGSNGVGSGRINVRLYNKTLGKDTYHQIGIFNKEGGWQTVSGTADLSSVNAGTLEDISANGGFNAILIIASNTAANIETLYFDDFKFSGFSEPTILSDTTSDLLTDNVWLYDNREGNFKSSLTSVRATVEEFVTSPSSIGNSATNVLKVTRGNSNANCYIQFNHGEIDYATAGSVKLRIFPVCKLGVTPTIKYYLRKNSHGSSQRSSEEVNLIVGLWNEVELDLSTFIGSDDALTIFDQSLLFFNFGDTSASPNETVYYLDAIQIPASTSIFDGDTDSNWANATNWNNDVLPNELYNVSIPSGQNPVINDTIGASVNNLTVDDAGSLIINAGGSLIVNGTSSGNVSYNRTLDFKSGNAKGWHLVGSPVASETYDNAYATANNLAISGTKRGLATYNTASDSWTYLEDDDSNKGTFISGVGYSLKTGSTGTVSFTGTINTADVIPSVAAAGNGFNLVSNPYTSYVNSGAFLTENTASLLSETIWLWNPVSENYEAKVTFNEYTLAPGQGFFVRASGGSVNFIESNQALGTGADTFQKSVSTRLEVSLMITDGTLNRFAKLYYLDNATTSFDNGYDGETFVGIANSLDVFTHLVSNSQGKNFQIQSLPSSDYENMVVPIGLEAAADKEITFSAEAINLPSGIKVFLEDKANNTFTELNENSNYKITLTEAIDGIGRFYMHTKSSALSIDDNLLSTVSIYKTSNNTLRITGLSQGEATITLYNILGAEVMQSSFIAKNVQDVSLPKLSTGIYIVQIGNGTNKINKQIILE
jgi:hypothetical protein